MKCLCSIFLCLGFSVTTHAYSLPFEISGAGASSHLMLATHYLDRKEIYYLGREEIHEVHEEDHDNAMPKRPYIYDPELYRGR